MKHKVKIESLPKAKTGMQVGYGLYNRLATMGGLSNARPQTGDSVSRTIGAVPREEANLEAEGGETVMTDLTGIGIPQHYTISGPRHAQGGVPMNLPDNSFIFSDFNEMRMKDPDVLNYFGKTAKKGGKGKGYTPADIAKQYDLNKYIQILEDPNADDIDKRTAEMMIQNYNLKLGALGLMQEAQKGFEDGVPEVSMPYMEHVGITEEDLGIQQQAPQEMMSPDMMMRGGSSRRKLKGCTTCGHMQQGGMPPEMMGQEQMMDPSMMGQPGMEQQQEGPSEEEFMAELLPMIEEMIAQGADANDITMELMSMQVPPEMIMQAFTQLGMPEGEAQMAIETAMAQGQPQQQQMSPEMMDPAMMQGQGMTPDMMPSMDPSMMQQGGEQSMEQMIAQALQEGVSPEEIVQALTQQGLAPEQAEQAVMSIAQQMQQMQQGQQGQEPIMRRGGNLPKAQEGQSTGYKFPTTTDAFGNPILVTTGDELSNVERMQRSRPGQGFGQQVQDLDKFMEVHSWYVGTLSPTDKEKFIKAVQSGKKSDLITNFQKAYNDKLREEAKKKRLSKEQTDKIINEVGFSDKGVQKLDGKFGAFTSSRPYFNFEKDKAKPASPSDPADPDKPADVDRGDIEFDDIIPYRDPTTAEWTSPDIVNFRGTIQDKLGIKSYYPWAGRYNPEFAQPVYMDPSRELAAQAEIANIGVQGLGQFAGPQALSSRMTSVQGQGAKGAADTLGRYNQANVGIANQFGMQNAQQANQAQQYNLAKAEDLFNKGVITQQQRDNSLRQANAAIRQSFGQGWKNASDIAMMNATSEQYNIDPRTGTVYHTGVERPMDPKRAAAAFQERVRIYQEMGLDGAAAVNAAKAEGRTNAPAFAMGGYVMGNNMFPFY
jgi:SOS response regulatory protein OraA/RecX